MTPNLFVKIVFNKSSIVSVRRCVLVKKWYLLICLFPLHLTSIARSKNSFLSIFVSPPILCFVSNLLVIYQKFLFRPQQPAFLPLTFYPSAGWKSAFLSLIYAPKTTFPLNNVIKFGG